MQSQHALQADQLKNNDFVWGQINSGVWWPGQLSNDVKNSKKKLNRVDFFGFPPIHAFLPLSKITKYGNNQNKVQKGRMSPGLKRAISQANILYKTLEESKNQLSIGQGSKPISEGSIPDEKTALLELEQNEREVNLENQNKTHGCKFSVKPKEIKDYKLKNKKIKKEKKVERRNEEQEEGNEEDINDLQKCLNTNTNGEGLLIRKLYKTLKRKLKREKSRKLAIQLFDRYKNKEWREVFEECRRYCRKGKKNDGILEKSRMLKRISQ